MKLRIQLLAIAALLFSINFTSAQVVQFNDVEFKNALLANTEINSNNDDEIQLTEAESFSGSLNLTNVDIADLTGLEAFISLTEFQCWSSIPLSLDVSKNISLVRLICGNLSNLELGNNEALRYVFTDLNNFEYLAITNSHIDSLICWHNNIPLTIDLSAATSLKFLNLNDNAHSSLDLSANSQLRTLICHVNLLTELELSNNPLLEYIECSLNPLVYLELSKTLHLKHLSCSGTQIGALELSQNIALEKLRCDYTPLSFLDVSKNENLIWLDCYNASLELLNVKNGNNINFEYFDVRANANLSCIQVDDKLYSETNWLNVSSTATYTEACEGILSSTSLSRPLLQYQAFPNPTINEITINLEQSYQGIQVEIYDYLGRNIDLFSFNNKAQFTVALTGGSGLLFIKVIADGKEVQFKVVKQ